MGCTPQTHADEVIATKRIWAARPLIIAYVLAVGFVVGILINRTPAGGHAVPTLADGAAGAAETERDLPDTPIWLQLFRPSQPTARWLLRMGLPMLSVADGSAQEAQRRNLITYWTGQAGQQPQSFFETMLPFLRPPGDAKPPAATEPPGPPVVSPPPDHPAPTQPDAGKTAPVAGGLPLVGIYNTHDWESYISEFPGFVARQPDDLNQIVSQDHKRRTVMELGKSLGTDLFRLGVGNVYADYTHHDLGYDYAYKSSRNTIKDILNKAPTVKVLLDLHRDSGVPGLDATATVAGQKVAQVRCIIGKSNSHYEQNEAFCDQLIKRLEQLHPGLTLPTRVKPDNVYNQDLIPGAILLEIGTTMNQYAEAERAVHYLAEALAALVREGEYPH